MGVKFTEEQQRVIDLRNCNILVSAAAGSGKTAVLVERIINRLTKDKPLLDVDRLLIVTFTDAAASEMKERIHGAIEKALELEPDNVHLQRQATLIHQAKITTMHTFCMSVVREYFHKIGLDPGFRVAETGELELLKRDILEEVLEASYQEGTPEFLEFVESFASGKDDRTLEDLILQLHRFSESYPNPEKWLDSCVMQYDISNSEMLEQKSFVKEIVSEVQKISKDLQEQLLFAIAICRSEEGPNWYVDALCSDIDFLGKLEHCESFFEMRECVQCLEWQQLGRKRKTDVVSEEKVMQVKAIRETVKDAVGSIEKMYFFQNVEEMCSDMERAGQHVKVLIELVKRFEAAFLSEKRRKNLIDFGDMEHYALQILTKEVDGELVPSEVAEAYQEKFDEVMIDEYQDSNFLQEAIMTSVSGIFKGRYNMFMVGDVKQSIYRFRLSRPELFMEKFHTYTIGEGEKQRIDLHKNFRSRREVLESTNYVFEQIMTPSLGGIEYDEKAALHLGAKYEEIPGNKTELLILDAPKTTAAERMELEAEMIARRIKDLKATHTVLDKATGVNRPVRYGDIVILARSLKGWNEVFSKVLQSHGIPTYISSKEGYFKTQEICVLLEYLKILDNPLQEIPFTSVLTSMFAGVTAEELALLRMHSDGGQMYTCVKEYLKDGENPLLLQKLSRFIELYETLRAMVPYTAIHVLLWQLLQESGYADYVAALPGGEQRVANLEMLVEKAVAFEGTSYKGLFHFVRYMEQMEKYEVEYGEANIMDEQMDVVSLMSIHKSKGLEFPIVFVAGLGKEFNTQDTKKTVQLHAEWGIGIDSIDSGLRVKMPTLLKKAISQKLKKESSAEELRVLYVAMTRAKEKLILTAAVPNLEKRINSLELLHAHRERQLPYYTLVNAKDFLEWILASVCRGWDRELPIQIQVTDIEELVMREAEETEKEWITREILSMWDTNKVYDAVMKGNIEEQFHYCYPYSEGMNLKQKLSVSEIKKRHYVEAEGEMVYQEEEIIPLLPNFLQEDTELKGASRGTAYHKFLEILDYSREYDRESLLCELEEKRQAGHLTDEMVECIKIEDILTLLHSNLGKRMRLAASKGVYFTEQPFVLGMEEGKETILIQGIIDVYFEEEDGLVLLDYKTDRVYQKEELIARYKSQLDYYAEALRRLTGKPVKERLIYSFSLQTEIAV